MAELQQLKRSIEKVREELDKVLANSRNMKACYELNLQLDALIERYINLQEAIKE